MKKSDHNKKLTHQKTVGEINEIKDPEKKDRGLLAPMPGENVDSVSSHASAPAEAAATANQTSSDILDMFVILGIGYIGYRIFLK